MSNTTVSNSYDLRAQQCGLIAGLTLLYYDYFVTLTREIDLIWRQRPYTRSTLLFVCVRYLPLLCLISQFLPEATYNDGNTACLITFKLSDVLSLLSDHALNLFLILRVYAISGKRRWLVVLLLFPDLLLLAADIWIAVVGSCHNHGFSPSDSTIIILNAIGLCALEAPAVIITITQIYGEVSMQRKIAQFRNGSFSYLMLQYSLLYSLSVFGIVGIGMGMSIFGADYIKSFATTLSIPLRAAITSRLFLKLRSMNNGPNPEESTLWLPDIDIAVDTVQIQEPQSEEEDHDPHELSFPPDLGDV